MTAWTLRCSGRWGVVLFSVRLDMASVLGIALIALAGIIVIRR